MRLSFGGGRQQARPSHAASYSAAGSQTIPPDDRIEGPRFAHRKYGDERGGREGRFAGASVPLDAFPGARAELLAEAF